MMFNKENTHDSWFPKFRTFVVSDGSGGEKLGFDGMVKVYCRLFSQDNLLMISFAGMFV